MFTGIIEDLGVVSSLVKDKTNLHITVKSALSPKLKIDQSLAHNGICLTVIAVDKKNSTHTVTAIEETLSKTNLKDLTAGDHINLERAMKLNQRLDGHIVQGHVDQTARCTGIKNEDGSWVFSFEYNKDNRNNITIEKGSIAVNGVSLTVVNSAEKAFDVAIIPYTYEHTNFGTMKVGSKVNLEFDMIGKYIVKLAMYR